MNPSKRYELLCAAAAAESEKYLKLHANKVKLATEIAVAIADYFGMPDGAAGVIDLDENLCVKGQKKAISSKLDLRIGDDGLSYFGLNLHFQTSASRYFGEVVILIGLDITESGYIFKHLKPHAISDINQSSLESFLSEVFNNVLTDYSIPKSRNKPRMGFIDV